MARRRMGVAIESCGTHSAVPVRRALCAGLCPTAARLLGTAVAGHGDPGTAEYQMVRLAGPGSTSAYPSARSQSFSWTPRPACLPACLL